MGSFLESPPSSCNINSSTNCSHKWLSDQLQKFLNQLIFSSDPHRPNIHNTAQISTRAETNPNAATIDSCLSVKNKTSIPLTKIFLEEILNEKNKADDADTIQ